jgi:hypothetical protein
MSLSYNFWYFSDDYKALSDTMQKIIQENFTAKIMSEKYQKLYDKLIDKRS